MRHYMDNTGDLYTVKLCSCMIGVKIKQKSVIFTLTIDPSRFNNKLPCSPDHPAKMGKIWVPSVC